MGQPSRAAELREDLSRAVTLPFPHLFNIERKVPTAGESRDGKYETA